ncbi:C4-dicarboxylate ABC transporter permease [Ruegeria pomeroyi]|uniref:TRAP transporter small permease protein n=1 Tax=Ruegeria alba TaxID=2916756 RepID=A0ABS9P1R2_9RHOB|nr:TRAP transporter small permease subunit [Ruegeria alba]MCE8511082.1 C4-dicarboxylate ABC transporter permease [Ruegeria pomeroyi]MCE8518706.1 C4-dicarboxylate ABC transporter permease [Ruegeria pomeroyi]MCE8524373.1 C4-dicarboxylate ABC transporter permease [Ruegeria pomeroyi]MCE8528277.1 C4-dicarboxylate ABC transporter permease [Ruegeria pomeroyi]MCE8531894.1 C4-dicarboxylate ABC transporter permease [Ruegeria pomeroyi]
MQDDNGISFFGALWNGLIWLFQNIAEAFYNFGYAVTHPQLWLDWSDKASIMRFVYYGGSVEFFFVVFTFVLVLTAIGMYFRSFMWLMVRGLEGFANTVGRFFAWAGLLMVLQQIIIVFMQRVFARPDLSFGFGIPVTLDVSWWSEELKLYNAMVVCLCATYTFVQGGHVRVDLIYSGLSHRGKRVVDMAGSLLFMMPVAVVTWLYGWYFLWRHLIVPNPSASDQLDRLLMKSRALRWNVETIGFSPNGFNGYFLFKILLITFAAMVFIHAVAFFYRSWLEFVEGESSAGKYLDKDTLGEGEEAYEGTH